MIPALTNHLWQSTLFAALAGLLTLALRRNRAQTRHLVWLAASMKFLLPFSLLVALGGQFTWRTAPAIGPGLAFTIEETSRPFVAPMAPATTPTKARFDPAPILEVVWACGILAVLSNWLFRWQSVRSALRSSQPSSLPFPIPVRTSHSLIEPGIFGIFRPVLLLPEGITTRLTPEQLHAILAHELTHVRRRDNLTAILHMLVEAIFWFHPLVWWIGTRLVEERERACDEEVVQGFGAPQIYAEGILNVCKLYVESPVACVSGVTGANLRKRIEAIMANQGAQPLNYVRKIALAFAGVAALALPVALGVKAQTVEKPQAFDVASVKLNNTISTGGRSGPPGGNVRLTDGSVIGRKATTRKIIQEAYRVTDYQIFGPAWIDSDAFDLDAKAEKVTDHDQLRQMLQTLLTDRFKLAFHRGTKEMAVYFLTVGKNGPGPTLHLLKDGEPEPELHGTNFGGRHPRPGPTVIFRGTLPGLALNLSGPNYGIGRPIVDKTGLEGKYLGFLHWGETDDDVISALQDEFDLKLEPQRATLETLTIDHVERPSAN